MSLQTVISLIQFVKYEMFLILVDLKRALYIFLFSTAISLGALAITENYPENVRILCTVSGSQWNSHYLETHNLTWTRTQNGVAKLVSANGEMSPGFDQKRYSVYFDPKRYFVILDIKGKKIRKYTLSF